MGLDGIWLNFFGANALLAVLSTVMLSIVGKEIKKASRAKKLITNTHIFAYTVFSITERKEDYVQGIWICENKQAETEH